MKKSKIQYKIYRTRNICREKKILSKKKTCISSIETKDFVFKKTNKIKKTSEIVKNVRSKIKKI